jgi:CubicO group peptidase (beta-lactamase class C family)
VAAALPLLAGAAAAARAQPPAREPFPGLDAYITQALADWKVPGLGLAIVRNDSVLYLKGYGVRHTGTRQPVDAQTVFAIGSASKAFTTAALAMLADSGRLAFDAPVTTYLPGLQLYDPAVTRELTVRDIVSHRSGLARGDQVWYASGLTPAEILRRVRHLRPSWSVRSQFGYQNIMYIAAGEVLATVAGMRWEEFVATRFFAPLGMTASTTTTRGIEQRPEAATPHAEVDGTVRPIPWRHIDNAGPAGSINSTVTDMAQWVRLQLGQGTIGGRALYSRRMADDMHSPSTIIRLDSAARAFNPHTHFASYGLGWFLEDYRGRAVVHHGGNIDGFSALVAMLPEERFGVVLLTNMNATGLPTALMRKLFDLQLKAPARDWSADALARTQAQLDRAREAQRRADSLRPPAGAPSLPLARYAGTYVDSLYGTMVVTEAGGALRLAYGPNFASALEHWNGDNFRAKYDSPVLPAFFVSFRVTPTGTVSELVADMAGTPATFTRAAPPAGAAPPR